MSLAQQVGRAGVLLFFRKMWGALVHIGVMAYLARRLDTFDFGLVAISGTLISFIQTLGVSGIGEYVVFYSEDNQKEIQNAAFWLNLVITVLIAGVVLIAAPFWANQYGDPRISHLVSLLLVGFVSSMISTVPEAVFRKTLDYQPMVTIQTIFGTLSQLSQMVFAVLGFGVYSLAIPNATISPMLALALLWRSGFRPRLADSGKRYWRQIFGYTKHVIGARFLTKCVNEGDTLLIGKLFGMETLGIYDVAFKLANIFNAQLLPIITSVSLPIFAQNQHDLPLVRQHYLKMIRLIGLVFFPISGVVIVFAPKIIPLLYGHKWDSAILPFQILCVFAAFRSLSSPTAGLYTALGKPQIDLYFTAAFAPVFFMTLYFSSTFGLVWVCVAVTVLRCLGSLFHFYMGNRLLRYGLASFWGAIRASTTSTLVAAGVVLLFPGQTPLALAPIFLLVFGLSMWFLFRADFLEKLALAQQLFNFNFSFKRT
jgi:O-antigen/teichoic acid export membrane protein